MSISLRVLRFSVDGTLAKAWASRKSFQPKPDITPLMTRARVRPVFARHDHRGPAQTETDPMPRPTRQNSNAEADFRGENATHASTTDPDTALQEIPRHRGNAMLHRSRADGEPLGQDRAGRADPDRWPWRTTHGTRHDPPLFPQIAPATDAWCGGQGIQRCQVPCRPAPSLGYAPRRPEVSLLNDRRPHHPAQGLCPASL